MDEKDTNIERILGQTQGKRPKKIKRKSSYVGSKKYWGENTKQKNIKILKI